MLFDECGGHYDEVCGGISILDTNYDFDSMHHILEKNKEQVDVLYEFYSMESSPGKIRFDSGMLTYDNKFEILLYHLTNFKVNFYFSEKKINRKAARSYYIDKFLIVKNSRPTVYQSNLYCKIRPLLIRLTMKLDWFFSSYIFNYHPVDLLKTGQYQYMKRQYFVECHNGRYKLIYPNGLKNEINFLKFSSTIFYDKKANVFYQMTASKNDVFTSFNQIFSDGGVMKYDYVQ